MTTKRNFYKKSSGSKKVLKQVIRPTHKQTDQETEKEPVKTASELPELKPKKTPVNELTMSMDFAQAQSLEIDNSEEIEEPNEIDEPAEITMPDISLPKPKVSQSPVTETDSEIQKISEMIAQASAKLKELEEQKKQQELLATQAAQAQPVEEFDGVNNDNEEIELIKVQLEKTQKDNKKLLTQMKLMQEEFEKEKKHLEKTVKDLKGQLNHTSPQSESKFFSFSKDLKEAVEAIHSLESADFQPTDKEVVIQTDPKILKLDQVTPKPAPTTVAPVVAPAKEEVKPVEEVSTPPVAEPAKPATPEVVAQAPKEVAIPAEDHGIKKKSKEKKLLISGVASLVVLVGGGFLSYQLTSTPKVNEKLVNEYLESNQNSQVLGLQTRKAAVPDGVVADKNAQINFEETHWAEYKDDVFGVQFEYPANVTERLHSANSITFLRKDSYIFKITKQTSNLELEEFWNQQKDKGVAYQAEAIEFNNQPALHLTVQESIDYPGDRYLVKYNDVIYDIFFITDPTKYDPEDVQRAAKMVESLRLM